MGGVFMQDRLWLRQYVEKGSQAAFANLVERYTNLVYSTCLRELHDATLAEDATQAVFLILADKAPALKPETVLSGWLFQTARFVAKRAHKREERRQYYEQQAAEAAVASLDQPEGDVSWQQLEPLLHDALATLRPKDRDAILLRFFEDKSLREVAEAMNISEDAARMRVTRAVEKLKQHFARLGFPIAGAVLVMRISAHAVHAAPATCRTALAALSATLAHGSAPMTATTGARVARTLGRNPGIRPGTPGPTFSALALYAQATRALYLTQLKATGFVMATSLCLVGAGLVAHLRPVAMPPATLRQPPQHFAQHQALPTRPLAAFAGHLPEPSPQLKPLYNARLTERVTGASQFRRSQGHSLAHHGLAFTPAAIGFSSPVIHAARDKRARRSRAPVAEVSTPPLQNLPKPITLPSLTRSANRQSQTILKHPAQPPSQIMPTNPSTRTQRTTQAMDSTRLAPQAPQQVAPQQENKNLTASDQPTVNIAAAKAAPVAASHAGAHRNPEPAQNDQRMNLDAGPAAAQSSHHDNGARDHGQGIGRGRGQGAGRGRGQSNPELWVPPGLRNNPGRGHNPPGLGAPDFDTPDGD